MASRTWPAFTSQVPGRLPVEVGYAGDPVSGAREHDIVLGDVADGNVGDWVTFSGLTLEWGKKKQGYFDWLNARLHADKQALTAPNADSAKLNARSAGPP